MKKEMLNPPELFDSQQYGFSQGVAVQGGRTVYLSGQVGWDAEQKLVGNGSFQVQTEQALRNIGIALAPAGGTLADVVSLRIYIVQSAMAESSHVSAALQQFFPENSPASTWIGVPMLANPDFLIEIEAIAVLE